VGLDQRHGSGIRIIFAPDFDSYYSLFNECLLDTDVLWTKPSELSFYAALGLPLVLAKPVGSHERYNRRWLREQGVAMKQHKLRHAGDWLDEWLEDGTLAAAAWTAFFRMSKEGTYRIVDELERNAGESDDEDPELSARLESSPEGSAVRSTAE
jgi:hypothetical protein